jgi:hypothetical protein
MITRWLRLGSPVAALMLLASASDAQRLGSRTQPVDSDTPPISTPQRQKLAAAPALVPALPASASEVPSMTLVMSTRMSEGTRPSSIVKQTVLRSADRVLVTSTGEVEWLFERNPVDGRRVSGYLTDHRTQRILVYQERDLRIAERIRGWLDVLTLRFDPESLNGMRATGKRTYSGGRTFTQYVPASPATEGTLEAWWDPDAWLPSRLLTRRGPTLITLTVDSIVEGVDASRLGSPLLRFPSYSVQDVTDAREDAH